MKKFHLLTISLGFFLMGALIGCSPKTTPVSFGSSQKVTVSIITQIPQTPTKTLSTPILTPQIIHKSFSPSKTPSPLHKELPSSTSILAPTPTPQCPQILPADSSSLLNGGSVIIWKPAENDRILGFSRKTKNPYDVIQHYLDMDLYFSLSPNGEKIAWLDFNQKPWKLIVHDLASGREMNFPYHDNWENIEGWIDDQTLRINIETASTLSKGIQNIYAIYDIQHRSVETETLNLDLPNYSFYPLNPWWGFASLDPKGELVLYTACEHSNCNVVLQNVHTRQEVWKSENGYQSYSPASWSKNGERAVFSMMSPDGQEAQLVLITRDGKNVKTNTPLAKAREIRDVNFSPDGQYVYFAEWWSSSFGPGYVLDVDTGEIRQICTPGYLLGSAWWIPGKNQLVYTVRKGNEPLDLGIMELRILDLDSWTTQVIATGENKETNFRFIGWTPIEFP
jgi:hypothetical protein